MSGLRAPTASTNAHTPPTPLWAINSLTFMASIGTGVVWNGISFIAEHDYRFSKKMTLSLYLVMGLTYVIGAFSTGRVLRWLESVLSPRTALGAILLCESLVCLSLWLVRADWMLWAVACVMSVLSSWCWPIVESYLTAGRHGAQMRSAIGWWNMSWTGATAIALVLMTFVMQTEARMAIVLLGALHAVALIPLMRFERSPGKHDHESSATAVQREYPFLLRAAHTLLPMAYVMVSAMGALMPYLMNDLHLDTAVQTPTASIWMWARIVSMAIMWQLGFWHGRWGTLLLGAVAMTLGFAMIVAGVSVPLMACGLVMFGAGMGIIYYAALYYAMSVGKAEVDAGGTFEALIGVGYAVGPLTGLTSALLAGEDEHRFTGLTIGIVWALIIVGGLGVLKPYRSARAGRTMS
jgi:MFS family permease